MYGIKKVSGNWFLKWHYSLMGPSFLSSRTFRFSLLPPGFLDFLLKMIYSKVLGSGILKLDVNWIFFNVKKYSTSYGASNCPK